MKARWSAESVFPANICSMESVSCARWVRLVRRMGPRRASCVLLESLRKRKAWSRAICVTRVNMPTTKAKVCAQRVPLGFSRTQKGQPRVHRAKRARLASTTVRRFATSVRWVNMPSRRTARRARPVPSGLSITPPRRRSAPRAPQERTQTRLGRRFAMHARQASM